MHISKPGEFARVLTHSNLYQDFQTIKDNTQGSISAMQNFQRKIFLCLPLPYLSTAMWPLARQIIAIIIVIQWQLTFNTEEISNKLHTYNLTYKDYLNKVMYLRFLSKGKNFPALWKIQFPAALQESMYITHGRKLSPKLHKVLAGDLANLVTGPDQSSRSSCANTCKWKGIYHLICISVAYTKHKLLDHDWNLSPRLKIAPKSWYHALII